MNRLWVNDQEGDVDACESDARALTVTAPEDTAYLEVFPEAIAAQGHPREAVEDALRPVATRWAARHAYREGQTAAALDVLDGRFDVARTALEGLQERYASNRDPWRWLYITRTLFALLEEVGDTDAEARLAENLGSRLSVLPTNAGAEDWAMVEDPVPLLYEARYHAKAIPRAARDAQREAWIASWRARTSREYLPFLWVHAYATYAATPEDAAEAVRARDSFGPVPPYRPKTATNADVGRTLLLAGDVDAALPYLKKATRSCLPLDQPFPFVRSQLWLGEALAKKGDTAGACAAWSSVVARWGDAKLRSLTAAAARAKAKDFGCAK
jgi:serine/threonine-protein kinase